MGKVLTQKYNRWAAALVIVFVLILGLTIATFVSNNLTGDKSRATKNKIEKLSKDKNTSCEEVIAEVGAISPDTVAKNDVKRDLLENQMQCFADQYQYDKAIIAAEKLETLYNSQGDAENVKRIEYEITNMKESQKQQSDQAEQRDDNDS